MSDARGPHSGNGAHVSEELPRLLSGEATRETTLAAAAHLRGCADCQQELVSAVIAHAGLMSAQRFAPEAAAARRPTQPPERPTSRPLPDLSVVVAQVRAESDAAARRRTRVVIGVAAAAVLVGGGVVGGVLATQSSTVPHGRTVSLVGAGHAVTATLIGSNRMRIDASSLPALGPRKQYEVWLTNSAGTAMQSVGFIRADRHADIAVPAPLMAQYQEIAVSVQGNRQTRFSGKVVVRGRYA